MKRIFIFLFSFSFYHSVIAQYENAINLGMALPESSLQGTARFVGAGGVMGSVGGDISNLSTNPAGIGMFSRSEFEISPTLQLNNVNTDYQYIIGNTTQGSSTTARNQVKFSLNSMGIVFANRRSEKESLRASNISIGINRTANYNRIIDFTSENRAYAYSNYLSDNASEFAVQGIGPLPSQAIIPQDYNVLDPIYNRAIMSREAQLSLYDNTAGYFIDPVPYKAGRVKQTGSKKISGGITELSVGWSGNFQDKGYIGVAMGIPFLSYRTEYLFQEDNLGQTYASPTGYGLYQYMDLSENDLMTGAGLNLKLGGLYKIDEHLRASAYFHTPTIYRITSEYAVGITSKYQNSNNPYTIELQPFDYTYFSPLKLGTGISYIFDKKGFIGAEYEFTNNMGASIDLENAAANGFVNKVLHDEQINTHKLRVGGELALSIFRLRGGYNYTTGNINPSYQYKGISKSMQTYTGGIGIRGKAASFDLAYMRNQYDDSSEIYGVGNESFRITNRNVQSQIVATFNYRFQ